MSQSPVPDDAVLVDVARALSELPPATLTGRPRWKEEAAGAPMANGHQGLLRGMPATKWTVSLVAGVLLLGVVMVITLSGPTTRQAVALPIFSRPPVDASQIRAATAVLKRNAANYGRARAIDTPTGTGYVMTADHDSVCIAVPDAGNGYGQSCAAREEIVKRGLLVELSSQDGNTSRVVALVPPGTTDVRLRGKGASSDPVVLTDGVLSVSVNGPAELTYRTPRGQVTVPLNEPVRCLDVSPGTSDEALSEIEASSGLHPCAGRAG